MERLVDVEAVHVAEPLVVILIGVEPLVEPREHPRGEEVGLFVLVEVGDVPGVPLAAFVAIRFDLAREARIDVGRRLPEVELVSADELEAVEVFEVSPPAVFEVVVVVGDLLCDYVFAPGYGGDRLVEGLDGSPGPPEELPDATEKLAAGGHAGETPGVVGVEDGRALREPVEVGGTS